MKKIIIILFVTLLSSCSTSRNLGRTDLFILTPQDATEFIEQEGFLVKETKIMMNKGEPIWIVKTPDDYIILNVYGQGYYIPDNDRTFQQIPDQYKFYTGGRTVIVIGGGKQSLKIKH